MLSTASLLLSRFSSAVLNYRPELLLLHKPNFQLSLPDSIRSTCAKRLRSSAAQKEFLRHTEGRWLSGTVKIKYDVHTVVNKLLSQLFGMCCSHQIWNEHIFTKTDEARKIKQKILFLYRFLFNTSQTEFFLVLLALHILCQRFGMWVCYNVYRTPWWKW